MMLHGSQKSVTKFWIRMKRTKRSHRCPADTKNTLKLPPPTLGHLPYEIVVTIMIMLQ